MSRYITRALSLSLLIIVLTSCAKQTQSSSATSFRSDLISDVKTVCEAVSKKYAFFDERSRHWNETCDRAEREASLLEDKNGSLYVLERMIDDLYDPHISFNTNTQNSPRLVPSGSDIWFEKIQEKNEDIFVISAVRPLSGAAKSGLKIGDQLVSFNGITPYDLALTRMHSGTSKPAEERVLWAINAAVAGKRSSIRNIEVRRAGTILPFAMDTPEVPQTNEPISFKMVTEELGYIRFNNSLGNSAALSTFDQALNDLRQSQGLILDLRSTPGGGNTGVAEPIIGRFINQSRPYQRTVYPNGLVKDRKVKPSGPWTYEKPLIILVGRWTGSMGEGMAIGFDAMGRGTVIGSQMAGLAGGTEAVKLKKTGIELRMPTYDLHHLNGTPRHKWKPLDLSVADNSSEEDILLQKAILTLQSG